MQLPFLGANKLLCIYIKQGMQQFTIQQYITVK